MTTCWQQTTTQNELIVSGCFDTRDDWLFPGILLTHFVQCDPFYQCEPFNPLDHECSK